MTGNIANLKNEIDTIVKHIELARSNNRTDTLKGWIIEYNTFRVHLIWAWQNFLIGDRTLAIVSKYYTEQRKIHEIPTEPFITSTFTAW